MGPVRIVIVRRYEAVDPVRRRYLHLGCAGSLIHCVPDELLLPLNRDSIVMGRIRRLLQVLLHEGLSF